MGKFAFNLLYTCLYGDFKNGCTAMKKMDRDKKRKFLKIAGILSVSTLAISVGYTSIASIGGEPDGGKELMYFNTGSTPLNYSYNISAITSGNFALNSSENLDLVVEAKEQAEKAALASSVECADPENPNGLGRVQKKELENERKRDMTSVDLDKIFQVGDKNGCFSALSNFPDLSVSIPTLTGMLNSVKSTLINYATRKACSVVDDALESALGPIKDQMNNISDRGMLDLNGKVNSEILKQMYELDPELGRLSTSAKPDKEYDVEFKW